MRRLGLLGGMSWHSTAVYYERINRGVAARLGPYRSADLVLHSVDYGLLRHALQTGEWKAFGKELVAAARGLKRAGAEGLVIGSNTIHRFAPTLQAQTGLPVLHVADAVVAEARERGLERVGLLATAYTTRSAFYRERLEAGGLEVLVAEPAAVDEMDRILLEEVARGELHDASRQVFLDAMAGLRDRGAEGMVLGCTEIGLLVGPEDLDLPMLETVAVHADYAVDWSLAEEQG